MNTRARWLPLLALLASACLLETSRPVSKLLPANGPAGDSIAVSLIGSAALYVGELLAVDSTRLAFLQDPRVREIPWTDIRQVKLQSYGKTVFISGTPPDTAEIRLLRGLSRFPQGMDSSLAARVHAAREAARGTPERR